MEDAEPLATPASLAGEAADIHEVRWWDSIRGSRLAACVRANAVNVAGECGKARKKLEPRMVTGSRMASP